MTHLREETDLREQKEEEDIRFTTSLAGLAVTLLLALLGLYLLDALSAESKLEDCFLQGRANCVPIEVSTQQ